MRKDVLITTTQGVRGGQHHISKQGMTRVSVTKAFNEPTDTIEFNSFEGIGESFKGLRETTLINITFADGAFWYGDFRKLQQSIKQFPNHFDNWHETHFEVVSYLNRTLDIEGSFANSIMETQGTGGMYLIALSLTDEFEQQFKGREWDGDFFDTLEDWLVQQETKAKVN